MRRFPCSFSAILPLTCNQACLCLNETGSSRNNSKTFVSLAMDLGYFLSSFRLPFCADQMKSSLGSNPSQALIFCCLTYDWGGTVTNRGQFSESPENFRSRKAITKTAVRFALILKASLYYDFTSKIRKGKSVFHLANPKPDFRS